MRLTRALSLTLLLTLAPAAAAHAAKISTTASEADYLAEGTDTISMSVHIGFDDDLRDTGVFFFPSDSTIVDPTTSDANCRARPTGASSCLYRGLTRITLLGQNDFVLVNAAGDTVRVDAGGGNDIVRTSGTGTKMVSNGEGGNDELMGGAGTDLLDGGPGDDKLVPLSFGDDVHGGTGFDTAQMQNGGVVATLDETQND